MKKEKTFDYLTNDLAFKQVFMHEELVQDLINSFLDYVGKSKNVPIITVIPEAYISPNKKGYRGYYGDIIVDREDTVISLEMYSNIFDTKAYKKSLGYLCRLYSNQKVGINPKDYKKVIGINFIKGNYQGKNNDITNPYSLKNKDNQEIGEDVLLYLVRYDLVDKIPYKEDEDRFIRYLRIIGSTDIEDMKKYAKGDPKMEETIKWLTDWCISSDKENYNMRINEAYADGEESGIFKGEEQKGIEIAQSLMNKNFTKDFILEITKISEEDYNKLINLKE